MVYGDHATVSENYKAMLENGCMSQKELNGFVKLFYQNHIGEVKGETE